MPASHEMFEKLFKLHHRELSNLAYNLVRDADIAKDVIQEVFLKLWQNKEQLEFGEQIKHYLFKATAHTALNHIRAQKKTISLQAEHTAKLYASPGQEEVTYLEFDLKVRESIDRLPPKCKAIYLMSRQEGMKYQQIAETLDISIKTVENQMGIALEKLREDLKPYLSPEFLVILVFILYYLLSII